LQLPDYGRIQRSGTTWRGRLPPDPGYSVIERGSCRSAVRRQLSALSCQLRGTWDSTESWQLPL